MTRHYATANVAGEVARYYPFNEEGYLDAYNHAKPNGYDVWETEDRELIALVYRARSAPGPKALEKHLNRSFRR